MSAVKIIIIIVVIIIIIIIVIALINILISGSNIRIERKSGKKI